MAAASVSKKRKSTSETDNATKKVKIVEAVAPLKSALKKSKDVKSEAVSASKSKKTTRAVTEVKSEVVPQAKQKTKPTSSKAPVAKASKAHSAFAAKPAKKAISTKKESKKAPVIIDAEDAGADLTSDQTAALLAGFSDSEDEEDVLADPDHDAIPVAKIPSAPTTGLVKKRIKMAIDSQSDPETTPGVIFIGRLPHGFYEHQLRAYLSQFGDILHLRLARNKYTGRSQHYAFVEFASAAVSDIVAKTMDKYLLFDHILQVRRVRREDVKENMFAGESRKKPVPRNKLERGHLKRGMVREAFEGRVEKETQKRQEKEAKLKEMGYNFAMPVLKAVSAVAVKPKEILAAVAAENGEEGDSGVPVITVTEQAKPDVVVEVSIVKEPNGFTVEETVTTKKRAAKDVKKKAKKVKTV